MYFSFLCLTKKVKNTIRLILFKLNEIEIEIENSQYGWKKAIENIYLYYSIIRSSNRIDFFPLYKRYSSIDVPIRRMIQPTIRKKKYNRQIYEIVYAPKTKRSTNK